MRTCSTSSGEPITPSASITLIAAEDRWRFSIPIAIAAVADRRLRARCDAPFDLLGAQRHVRRDGFPGDPGERWPSRRAASCRMPSCATALKSSFDCEYVVSAVSSRTRLARQLREMSRCSWPVQSTVPPASVPASATANAALERQRLVVAVADVAALERAVRLRARWRCP